MPDGQLNRIVQHLCRAALQPDGGDASDGQLLEAFITRRDQIAFEALMQRHGPMVMGVCRRVLQEWHDAEDAFQATFLVLVRKAHAIARPALLGNWLYGVAYRTALQAKTANARRKVKEQLAAISRDEAEVDPTWLELRPLLDRELSRLPDKYRSPVVLCDLEGKTQTEAAELLGCPVGTVASRLARARAKLAKRLSRHGLAVSAGALGLALSTGEATAAISPALSAATLKAACWLAAGQALTGPMVSANVVALVKGVMQSMLLTKLKIVAMLLLVFGAAGVGGTSLAYQLASTPQNDAVAIALDPKVQSDQEKLKQEIEQLRKELQQTKDEVQALKAKLAAGGQESKDLLYQGKPPSFWLKQLKDRDAEFRRTAIGALGELAQENRALISVLIDCLKDRNFAVRTDAAQKLALIGPPADAAVPALVEGLKSEKLKLDDGTVGYALAMIDPDGKKSIPVLTTLLRDSDELVRMSAAILLARVAPKSLEQIAAENKELIQAYVSCLIHKQQMSYIMEAAVALGAIGPRAKEALPALIDTFKKYPKTRVYFEAIEKIDPEAAAKLKADKKPSQ